MIKMENVKSKEMPKIERRHSFEINKERSDRYRILSFASIV